MPLPICIRCGRPINAHGRVCCDCQQAEKAGEAPRSSAFRRPIIQRLAQGEPRPQPTVAAIHHPPHPNFEAAGGLSQTRRKEPHHGA